MRDYTFIKNLLFFLPVFFPIVAGICIATAETKAGSKNTFSKAAVIVLGAVQLVFTALMIFLGTDSIYYLNFFGNTDMCFKKDRISILFNILISFVFFVVSVYATDYIKHEDGKTEEESKVKTLTGKMFFGFYFIVWGVLSGLSLAGDLVTFYMFYELMTLSSMVLVLHDMTKEAMFATKKYAYYSIAGASLALFGFCFMLFSGNGSLEFIAGGNPAILGAATGANGTIILVSALCMIIGFGGKAGLFPLHGWLPSAHPVSPAPASAVLSGIIAKAGVLGIIRVIFFIVGPKTIKGTWVQYTVMFLALLTVFMGSMLAYKEKVFKKRLAYSTVSQVSYVLFGIMSLNPVSFIGALMHVVFHAVLKSTLFLNAGTVIYATGKHDVEDLKGIGKAMPITMLTFTTAGLGLVGIPPVCGFVSKWYLCMGALSMEPKVLAYVGIGVLLASAILTAGYLLSITIVAFFPGEEYEGYPVNLEKDGTIKKGMIVSMVIFAVLAVILGIFANVLFDFIFDFAVSLFR